MSASRARFPGMPAFVRAPTPPAARISVALASVVLASLLGSGCVSRARCGGAARLELRRGDGSLELRLVDAPPGARPGELDLCDPSGQRLGGLLWDGLALSLVDPAGADRLRVVNSQASEIIGPNGPALRLWRNERSVRVLRLDGVPYGTLSVAGPGPAPETELALVSDPGGSPLAKVSSRDADAVLAGPDGATLAYVVPSPGLVPAAVFALVALPLEERAFLAVHLARPRFAPR